MKKFKKAMALSLAMAMGLSVVACGGTSDATTAAATEADKTEADSTEAESTEATSAEGTDASASVLNIYCWNEEFKSRLTDHYPGYEVVDATHGKIGDVSVVWTITPSDNGAYQDKLDDALSNRDSKSADEQVDLFLLEADYALKYVNTDYTMAISDLGITADDIKNQYKYTQDIVTDSNGVLKGLSWQGCPGVLIYNREIAKDVLGSDDPDTVQESVKDWATFKETAKAMKDKGYLMTSTVDDTYRVFSDNASSPWVVDGKVQIDSRLDEWVDLSKEMADAGQTQTAALWSNEWKAGFYPAGTTSGSLDDDGTTVEGLGVFCYFGPAWLIDFCMSADDEASVAYKGGWGATTGPEGFSWGGTWIAAATGTDNADLIADIMKQLTCNTDIMKDIVTADNDFVNDKPAMEAMAADTSYGDKVLGGQNALSMFCAGAEKIDRSNQGAYDQGCNEEFQGAMRNYFQGNATKEEALDLFKKAIVERYPALEVE